MALQKSESMSFSGLTLLGRLVASSRHLHSFRGLRPQQGAAESSPVPVQQMLSETSSSHPIFLADADRV